MKAYIDKRKCPAYQDMCKPMANCPGQALSWIEDEKEKLGARMEIDVQKCKGCGTCISLCCGDCIELK